MPGRYEIVDEPVETLEVIDDEVYHSDLTIRDTQTSFRSLEPIVGGPITLKMIFYDPRWSTNKRRGCLCFVGVTSLICFCLMISLFVGLGQVLSYINESERLRQTGLHMVPDLEQSDVGIFVYSADKNYEFVRNRSIAEIQTYLDEYNKKNDQYQPCDGGKPTPGKPCRFDMSWLGTNCVADKRYGYDNGTPCILFAFRNVKGWGSNVTQAFFDETPELRMRMNKGYRYDQNHLPVTCNLSYALSSPSPQGDDDGFRYYPEAGFNLSFLSNEEQLPPLVFVQFVKPPDRAYSQITVKCQVWMPRAEEFRGVRSIDFDFDNVEDIQGSALDRP